MSEKIGFIGLGAMGQKMAMHLIANGFDLNVYDPNPNALMPLLERGACSHTSPKEVADAAQIVLVCVPTPEVVDQVILGVDGVIEGKAVRIVVDHSTTGPSMARHIHQVLATKNITALDAPLAGGVIGAKDGTLSVMVGGDRSAYLRCLPVFGAFGRKVEHIGDRAGLGQTLKLVNNMIVASTLVGTAEALLFGIKSGLDAKQMLDILNVSTAHSFTSETLIANSVLSREFDFGFRLDLMHKDIRLFLTEAEKNGSPAFTSAVVKQFYDQAMSQGDKARDMSHVVEVLEGLARVKIQG